MALVLYPENPITIRLVVADENGDASVFDHPPQWTGDDSVLRLTPAEDGMSAQVEGLQFDWTTVTVTARANETVYTTAINLVVREESPSQPWRNLSFQAIFGVRQHDVQFTRKLGPLQT